VLVGRISYRVLVGKMQTALKINRRLRSLTETYLKKNATITNSFINTGSAERIFQWCIAHFSISRGIISVSLVIITLFFLVSNACPWSCDWQQLMTMKPLNEVTTCVVIQMPGLVSIMKKNRDTWLKTRCSLIS
jgi:hypothetical protein